MNTTDLVKLLHTCDPTGTLEVSIASPTTPARGWQTIASAQVLFADTGNRLVLRLKPSLPPTKPLAELRRGALFEVAGQRVVRGVKLATVKGGGQRVCWLATGKREVVSRLMVVREVFLPPQGETGR